MKYDISKGLFIECSPQDIKKIEYVHGLEPTESIEHAYKRLKCQIIINSNFFNMRTGKPCGQVIDEGEILANGNATFGIGFINKKTPKFSYKNDIKAKEYCSGYPCLVCNKQVFIDTAEYGFNAKSTIRRGRTAIGITSKGNFIIRAIADTDNRNKMSIKNLALEMIDLGCENAINLDGGGSTQWITPWSKFISGRKVDGFIAIWLNDKHIDNNKNSWQLAFDKGILDGKNPMGNIKRETLAVILDRLKLLD